MSEKESRASAIVKNTFSGGVLGALSGTMMCWAWDDYDFPSVLSTKGGKRFVVGSIVAGIVVGAFTGATRPLHDEKTWAERQQDRITDPTTHHMPKL